MRLNRRIVAMLLLLVGTIGAYVGVRAHGGQGPWPAPVTPPTGPASDPLPFENLDLITPKPAPSVGAAPASAADPEKSKAPWLLPTKPPQAVNVGETTETGKTIVPMQYVAPLPVPTNPPPAPSANLPRIINGAGVIAGEERIVPVPIPGNVSPALVNPLVVADPPVIKPEIIYPDHAAKFSAVVPVYPEPTPIRGEVKQGTPPPTETRAVKPDIVYPESAMKFSPTVPTFTKPAETSPTPPSTLPLPPAGPITPPTALPVETTPTPPSTLPLSPPGPITPPTALPVETTPTPPSTLPLSLPAAPEKEAVAQKPVSPSAIKSVSPAVPVGTPDLQNMSPGAANPKVETATPPALPIVIDPAPGPMIVKSGGDPPPAGTGPGLVVPNPQPERPLPMRLVNPLRRGVPANPPAFAPINSGPAAAQTAQYGPSVPMASDVPVVQHTSPPPPVAYAPGSPDQTKSVEAPTPVVTIDKLGPTVMKAGELLAFEIVLRNTGTAPATQIRLDDDFPQGAHLLRALPMPTLQKGKMSWSIGTLAPGAEQRIKLEMRATVAGPCRSEQFLTMALPEAVPQNRHPQAAGLNVFVRCPAHARVGQPVVFDIQVINVGPHPVHKIVLHADLSEGLQHKRGRRIEGDLDVLAAGADKTIHLEVLTVQPGQQGVECFITAANAARVAAQASIMVGQCGAQAVPEQPNLSQASLQVQQNAQGLQVQQNPTHRLLPGQTNEIRIEVVNHSPSFLRRVAVTDTLPEEVEYKGSSDGGMFHWTTRTVQWFVDLAPGQLKVLTLQLQPQKSGQWNNLAQARLGNAPEARSFGLLVAEGYPNLSIHIVGRDPQMEVGKETVYQIRVTNHGSAPATNVEVTAMLSEGLAVGFAQGAAYRTHGKQITFAPLPKLDPQAQHVFHVGVAALAPGDRRVRVQATSDQSPTPITREERTLVSRE